MFFVWFSTRERGNVVLLRRDKDEQKKKRIECMFLSNPVQVQGQGWWDEDVHVLGLVSYKGIHWRGGLRACSLFGWIHHGRKILIHWIARAAKCKLHTCFTTGYKWTLNFKKMGRWEDCTHVLCWVEWQEHELQITHLLTTACSVPASHCYHHQPQFEKKEILKSSKNLFAKNSALTHLKV